MLDTTNRFEAVEKLIDKGQVFLCRLSGDKFEQIGMSSFRSIMPHVVREKTSLLLFSKNK